MAKRFLCYDTDNPKGVTPEGVLDTNSIGGSEPDMVIEIEDTSSNDPTNWNRKFITIVSGSYDNLIKVIDSGKVPKVVLQMNYIYGDVTYKFKFESCSCIYDMNGIKIGGMILSNPQNLYAWTATISNKFDSELRIDRITISF